MGSRAVMIVCRDPAAARRRFGVLDGGAGIIYTRTGRRFFDDRALEAAFLAEVRAACEAAGLWEEFATDWACLDCELMPWSAKAQELLRQQYAAVGAAVRAAVGTAARPAAVGRAVALGAGHVVVVESHGVSPSRRVRAAGRRPRGGCCTSSILPSYPRLDQR